MPPRPLKRIKLDTGRIIALISRIIRSRRDGWTSEEIEDLSMEILELSLDLMQQIEAAQ